MKVDVFKVTWKSVTQNRFDTTGFKAAHKDIYDLFTTTCSPKRRKRGASA
jgi:predicted phage-related endonuclease